MADALQQQQRYLAQLLEAVQRCAYFLNHSESRMEWPLRGIDLAAKRKDASLFEALAAINERFAKLQDTLAAVMRHTALLMGEQPQSFLQILSFFEKLGVLESSERWQQGRIVRNMAAHEYETDYDAIAEHFNTLVSLTPLLNETARHLINRIDQDLDISPATDDFKEEFARIFDK